MANPTPTSTFDQLPAGRTPIDTDILPMEQIVSSIPNTYQVSALQLYDYINGNISGQYLPITGGTLTGPLFLEVPTLLGSNLLTDPTPPGPTEVVPYADVQRQATFYGVKASAYAATTENLEANYANGPDSLNPGIGATLTNAGTLEPLVIDGQPTILNDRIVVKDQSDPIENGVYILTVEGTNSIPWQLMRSSDFDGSADGQVNVGTLIFIQFGTLNSDLLCVLQLTIPTPPIVFGTTNIIFNIVQAPDQAKSGLVQLVSGTAFVTYPFIADNDAVQLTYKNLPVNPGFLYYTLNIGTGFNVISTSGTDGSLVNWTVFENANSIVPGTFGLVTLVSGNAVVNSPAIVSSTVFILSIDDAISSNGVVIAENIIIGTSFGATSGYNFDGSIIAWSEFDSSSAEVSGTVSLVSGNATVSLPSIASGGFVFVTVQNANNTLGQVCVQNIVPSTGFSIISSSLIDSSLVGWVYFPPTTTLPHGIATLIAGSITISSIDIELNSVVLIGIQQPAGSFGSVAITNIIPATSFTIESTSPIDTSTIAWVILN